MLMILIVGCTTVISQNTTASNHSMKKLATFYFNYQCRSHRDHVLELEDSKLGSSALVLGSNIGTTTVLVPSNFLAVVFKARNFTASSHQNAGCSI